MPEKVVSAKSLEEEIMEARTRAKGGEGEGDDDRAVNVKFSEDPDVSPTSTPKQGGKGGDNDDEREWTPDSDEEIFRAAGMR